MLAVLKHTRLKFAANVRNNKNVGFLLKHKSKDDNESRKGVKGSSINDESREEARKAKGESNHDNHR